MANKDIKQEIRKAGLKFWEVAYAMQPPKTDGMFSVMLRKELPDEKKAEIRKVISELKKAGEQKWN